MSNRHERPDSDKLAPRRGRGVASRVGKVLGTGLGLSLALASTAAAKPNKVDNEVSSAATKFAAKVIKLAETKGRPDTFSNVIGSSNAGEDSVNVKIEKGGKLSFLLVTNVDYAPAKTRPPEPSDLRKLNPHAVRSFVLSGDGTNFMFDKDASNSWTLLGSAPQDGQREVFKASTHPTISHELLLTGGKAHAAIQKFDQLYGDALAGNTGAVVTPPFSMPAGADKSLLPPL